MRSRTLLAALSLLAIPSLLSAQVSAADVAGTTVTATTVDGAGTVLGATTASMADAGSGLLQARPADPRGLAGFAAAVVDYCDPGATCQSFAPFAMTGGTWVASYYSAGVSRLLFDTGGSNAIFTGTANWLAQPFGPVINWGTFSFLNAVNGGFTQMQIDVDPQWQFGLEGPFEAGLALASGGGGGGCTGDCQSVPEPGTYLLMLTGVLGLGFVYRRRQLTA